MSAWVRYHTENKLFVAAERFFDLVDTFTVQGFGVDAEHRPIACTKLRRKGTNL
jgi:hypothetical protein